MELELEREAVKRRRWWRLAGRGSVCLGAIVVGYSLNLGVQRVRTLAVGGWMVELD